MQNYAGRDDVDEPLARELEGAGIEVIHLPQSLKPSGEVKAGIIGFLHGWEFNRAWSYWTATGPGLPPFYANQLHRTHGHVVRVDGHCGCPAPQERYHGLGVGSYHIDSAEGLKALADMLRRCVQEADSNDTNTTNKLSVSRFPVGAEVWVFFPNFTVAEAVVDSVSTYESSGQKYSASYLFRPGTHPTTYGQISDERVFATEAEAQAFRNEYAAEMRRYMVG